MNDLVRELRGALGATDLRLYSTFDYLTVDWETGQLSLMVSDLIEHDFDEDPDPIRYSIFYRPQDRFGITGAAVCEYSLGLGTTQTEIVHCLVHAIRHRRHGIPTPAPFRWGQARTTATTRLSDALARVGLVPSSTTAAFIWIPANRAGRAVTINVGRNSDDTIVWIGLAGTDGRLDIREAASWVFHRGTPPEVVAETAAYWGHDGPTDDPGSPEPDRPFPLARVGLTADIDAGLGPLVEHLHRAGLEILRVDLSLNRSPKEQELPSHDVITLRDDDRLFLLSRGPQHGASWQLHGALYGHDFEIPLKELTLPHSSSDVLPGGTTDPAEAAQLDAARLVASVMTAIADLPLPGEEETLFTTPQRFPVPASRLAGWAYLGDMLIDLGELLRSSATRIANESPPPSLIRSPHDAERAAAAWMRWMGYQDAETTPIGTDEGIDVQSSAAVAQVKTETVPVGRPALQRLFGVAHAEAKDGLFFSLSGYTLQAAEWAERVGLPLFTFDFQGAAVPANEPAMELFARAGR